MTNKINPDWVWNPDWMADDELKGKNRNSPLATADMIYHVIYTLTELQEQLSYGMLSWFSAMCVSKDMWDATNFARLWTEAEHQPIDIMLQDALSHVAETHYMIDSAHAWDKFTPYVMRNLSQELEAALYYLRNALVEVEFYLTNMGEGDKDGDDESRE
jgi:hypothetical protein